jgi:hypothetical protein
MTMASQLPNQSDPELRYIEQREPIVFPCQADVPETQLHLELRTLLYQLLQDALGEQATVGSDQFVYFDAEDPSRCLAPDAYVRRVRAEGFVRSWKVWERGAPEVAVEIISDDDAGPAAWQKKLSRYRTLGVSELVRFDPEDAERPLRVWNRHDGPLVERQVQGGRASSRVLDLVWVVAPLEAMPIALRIERDGVLVASRA